MKRSIRLARISDIRRLEEDKAAGHLASARQELAGNRQLLSELQRHRDDYQTCLLHRPDQKLAAMEWRNQRQFISVLDTVIDRQLDQIEKAAEKLDLLHNYWRKQHAGRRAVDELVQRTEDQEQREDDRREQLAQDDRSSAKIANPAFFGQL